jgi:bifunctional DNA-binding transcriptional regulator/antitoxin component of YhaV-PrlF toxin-antitoxin module
MKRRKVTANGQISLPASVRGRWSTSWVAVEDRGDHVVVRPLPDDPVAAARGALKGRVGSTTALRARARADDAGAQSRR